MSLYTLHHAGWDELILTLSPLPDDGPVDILMRGISALHRAGAELVRAVVYAKVRSAEEQQLRGIPVTFIEGGPLHEGASVAGAQLVGVRGSELTTYDVAPDSVISVVEDAHARWAFVSSVRPSGVWAPPDAQAREAFERAEAGLKVAGMEFRHVFRTWIYLDAILDWYRDFNEVRTTFYRERCVTGGVVPASTGIGAANPWGAAVVMDLLAVAPKGNSVSIEPVTSPLQCSAQSYGSTFSRAVVVQEPGLRRLFVSGTASIGPNGETLYAGDVAAQVERTLDVVEALLNSQGMHWGNMVQGVSYCRSGTDLDIVSARLVRRNIATERLVLTACSICRNDLLFEIELDAACPRN